MELNGHLSITDYLSLLSYEITFAVPRVHQRINKN